MLKSFKIPWAYLQNEANYDEGGNPSKTYSRRLLNCEAKNFPWTLTFPSAHEIIQSLPKEQDFYGISSTLIHPIDMIFWQIVYIFKVHISSCVPFLLKKDLTFLVPILDEKSQLTKAFILRCECEIQVPVQ